MFERFFSFNDRLPRLPFFLRGIQVGIAAVVIFFGSLPLFMNGGRVLWWAGIAVVAAAVAVLGISTVSLTVRRLHDLGLSGYHAIWVVAADAASEVLSRGSTKAVLFSLPLAAIGLWLIFWPGNKDANRFGAVPE
jgi:uncharacterized membrane protein YhaH (DUF805 family)